MGRRIGQWLELGPGDRWRLLGLMAALPVVSAMLALFGFVRTRRLLESASGNAGRRVAGDEELRAAQAAAWLTNIAGRRGAVTATCLRQSLLLYWLLRRRGLAPEIRLGVRKEDQKFDAHAWVELHGIALGETELVHLPFSRLN